ncbi:MAG: GTPase HflX [Oscillospiraceae bacterium]|nr:GTPase HflX [Oscillospiraceae bacterium]
MFDKTFDEHKINRSVLAGLNSPALSREENATEDSLAELAALLETAGGVCVGTVLQNKATPDPRTFLGEGKVEEVKQLCEGTKADLVIFDNDLSPSQQRVLTETLGVQVLDRSALILDIFAQRARTSEGRLQVELAQYKYLLPRLTSMWSHLERQEGAIGTRGPGETQLETDRRLIRRKITRLEGELKEVRRIRSTQRQRREKNEVPVVAIVGYTNAGKSTLLNFLTGAGIPANNRLFDTLDTTTRTLELSDTCTVLISDTVGFISKLPHQLVEAFKATLEELEYADLLLHVIDASDPNWQEQAEVVERLITELNAWETPRLEVFNKCDLLEGDILPRGEDAVAISARTGEGMEDLLGKLRQRLDQGAHHVKLAIPYDKGGLLDLLHREAKVEKVEYGEAIEVEAVCTPKVLGKVRDYVTEGWQPTKEPWED